MRMFETGELVLFATVVAAVDLIASLNVVLSGAYAYMESAPILALFATKAAVAVKTIVVGALLMMFGVVKIHALKKRRADLPPRVEKLIRTALYAYIAFVYATGIILAATLESLSVSPPISKIP